MLAALVQCKKGFVGKPPRLDALKNPLAQFPSKGQRRPRKSTTTISDCPHKEDNRFIN
jgi:hypothetical protein